MYCGVDIIEVSRIEKSIERIGNKFLNEIYTDSEIEYCNSKNVMKFEHYAARFAAKEAVFKAMSKLLNNKFDLTWKDIEVLNDKNGRPYINLNMDKLNEEIRDKIEIDISISHIKEYAIANCIVIIENKDCC